MTERRVLPSRRRSMRWHVHINGSSLFVTLGYYPDGTVGEVFLDVSKYGSALRTWVEDSARLLSVGLQHGVPLATLCGLFMGSKSDPFGRVDGYPTITSCTSVMDFVARLLTEESERGTPDMDDRGTGGTTQRAGRGSDGHRGGGGVGSNGVLGVVVDEAGRDEGGKDGDAEEHGS